MGKERVGVLKVGGDFEGAIGDVGAEADGEGGEEGGGGGGFGRWDERGRVENHFAEGPGDFDVVNFIDGLEGAVHEALAGFSGGFDADARNADAFVEDVDEPGCFEAGSNCLFLIHMGSPLLSIHRRLDTVPLQRAKVRHRLLIRREIIRLLIQPHLKNIVRGMPILTDTHKMVHAEINPRNMHALEQTRRIMTGRVLSKQWIHLS